MAASLRRYFKIDSISHEQKYKYYVSFHEERRQSTILDMNCTVRCGDRSNYLCWKHFYFVT